MTKLLIPVFLCLVMACASTKVAPTTPAPKAEPVAAVPEPVPPSQLDDEGSVDITVEAPNANWEIVSAEALEEDAILGFTNARFDASATLFFNYQKGTDAHKQAQILAIQVALQGGQPLHLHAEPDGSWAWLGYTGESEAGKMNGITDIRRSEVDPDLYVIVAGFWAVEHHNEAVAEFEAFVNSVKITPR